ncbi:hypothetical protein OUZ56_022336 [Daphnia magna]|uniref:Uncharacterized protein n=1 Tax=Daphnia magna TaxID=35525 RepID=A0ABR0AW35_9CRUS|nr:hypothetical protein OUZ56_022336 [Daphnia magna]
MASVYSPKSNAILEHSVVKDNPAFSMCFKGFFVKKIASFALSVAERVACIPAINILKLLCSASHPLYTSALHCGFSFSLLSLPNANRNKGSSPLPYHEIENVIVNPAAKSSSRTSHAVLDSSWNFLATSTQAEKDILLVVWTKPASPSSPRHPRLAVFASPSSPRHPRRLRLAILASPSSPRRLRLAILASPSSPRHPRLAVFASPSSPRRLRLAILASPSSPRHPRLAVFASPSSPRLLRLAILASPSSPRRLRLAILAVFASPRHPRLAVFASPSSPRHLRLIHAILATPSSPYRLCSRPASPHRRHRGTSRFWDRRRCSAPWLISHGVGQSPCALWRRRQCTSRDFPLSMRWWSTWGVHSRKGLHHQVSPDLSSDKSPFHRIPLKRCVANVEKQPTGCNGLAANGLT